MREIIIATLPTILLSKLKIVNILCLDFFQHNILSGIPPETIYNKPLYTLESSLLYLLQNSKNPNIDLLTDSVTEEIFNISENYYELISNEYDIRENNELNFNINENLIRHEIGQLFNDISLIREWYCKDKKIIGIELSIPDRVYLDIL